MNLRFPEIFGALLFLATLCSFALPLSASGRIASSFHVIFSPVAGPVQWAIGSRAERQADAQPRPQPIVTDQGSEVANLREENRRLRALAETLTGQVLTLARQQAEMRAVGQDVSGAVTLVRVLGLDGGGRDILKLAGSSAIQQGAAVVARGGIVGRVDSVGLVPSGASVRLITDRGFRTLGSFGRFEAGPDGTPSAVLTILPLEPRVIEGIGKNEMRVENITMADVQKVGLRVGDSVVVAGTDNQWPISLHGYRLGYVTYIGDRRDTPGVAEVRVRPEDLTQLREVGVLKKDEG